jgi:hypothetical protein
MSPPDELLELAQLRDELHQLERRVHAIEHRTEPRTEPSPPIASESVIAIPDFPGAIPAAGRAILGLAGAFLLRALAESGAMPRLLVVAAAILYAATWLMFSVRTRDAFAGAIYGTTSVLILAPLLWEATVRFQVLAPPATAAILIAFLALSSALTWRRPGPISTVTILATVVTAIALMIQTAHLVPFAAALLAIACITEASACYGRANMRVPVAIAADFAIWLLLYVMTRPGGIPESYQPVSLPSSLALVVSLFLIYSVSIVWQTAGLGRAIGGLEIVQSIAVFALAAGGGFQLTQGRAAAAIGALCAIACTASYFTAFVRFADSPRRNHYFFAYCGLALGLTASILILPESLLILIWSVAAVLATLAGARASEPTLAIHGALYLLAAGVSSGLPAIILNAFTAAALEPAAAALWIMAISAACCYAACYYAACPAYVSLVSALVFAFSTGALLMLDAVPLIARTPTPSLLATARTLVTSALAFAFGFTGSRTRRRELVWISYVAIVLGTVKLILEDFLQSHPAALAVSLVGYGAVLILVPKLNAKSSSISS